MKTGTNNVLPASCRKSRPQVQERENSSDAPSVDVRSRHGGIQCSPFAFRIPPHSTLFGEDVPVFPRSALQVPLSTKITKRTQIRIFNLPANKGNSALAYQTSMKNEPILMPTPPSSFFPSKRSASKTGGEGKNAKNPLIPSLAPAKNQKPQGVAPRPV